MEELFREGLAPTTRRTYAIGKRRYLRFCESLGLSPTPASEQVLQVFVASLARDGLAHSTVKNYLAAVRHLHLEEGLPDPKMVDMARLQLVVRGVKKQQARASAPRTRLPITVEVLHELRVAWREPNNPEGQMLWAAASLSEGAQYDKATHLNFGDVAVDNRTDPQAIRVRLKASKTDPFRRGMDVYVGKTGNALCPVAAMLAYLGTAEGPLFRLSDGKALSRPRFVAETQKALRSRGGSSAGYSGHSFQCGAATTAAERGLDEGAIKMLGHWSSAAYQDYIKTPWLG